MRDDREVDAEFYLGAPKNERERERASQAARSEHGEPGTATAPEEDATASATGSAAATGEATAETVGITDASLRYGIVEEADDDLGEGLYRRRAA